MTDVPPVGVLADGVDTGAVKLPATPTLPKSRLVRLFAKLKNSSPVHL